MDIEIGFDLNTAKSFAGLKYVLKIAVFRR